ncbi:MAG TPA: hypothetical protein VGC67_17645 [Cellulomonas sp.]
MLKSYLQSFFTRLGYLMGAVMYLAYAAPTGGWANPWLIGVATFVGVFLPFFARLSDFFEAQVFLRTGSVFAGKIGRFCWQFLFNFLALRSLVAGGIVDLDDLATVGGVLGAVALMSLASQGTQYLVIDLGNRNVGNRYLNVVLALSFNIVLGALAALGYGAVQVVFVVVGLVLGVIGAFWSAVTDIAGLVAPSGGVGVFFGTFNPVHTSHLRILREFIDARQLSKVYLHSTVVPSFYRGLLEEGVIEIAEQRSGMRVYRLTGRANLHIDYFPTGNTFYEGPNRLAMLRAALEDEHLDEVAEVLYLPEVYARSGFGGVLADVRSRHPHQRVHGLHGSDGGGSIVRMIFDSAFFVWPWVAIRRDTVSATAIRNGGQGMTHPRVDRIRETLERTDIVDGTRFTFGRWSYEYHGGVLLDVADPARSPFCADDKERTGLR